MSLGTHLIQVQVEQAGTRPYRAEGRQHLKAYYTDQFVLPLPEGHRFPMRKYAMLRQRVVEAGLVAPEDLRVPHAATDEEIARAHDPEYLRRVRCGELTAKEVRRIGFPGSLEMVERSRRSVARRSRRAARRWKMALPSTWPAARTTPSASTGGRS